MKTSELNNNVVVAGWLDGLNPADNTRASYLKAVSTFTEFTGMSPEELLG